MQAIVVERNPSSEQLDAQAVFDWPIWTHEAAEFPWTYDADETCYFLEGDVTVTPQNGQPTRIAKGDLVTFPKGMSCVWKIHRAVKKHYHFSE